MITIIIYNNIILHNSAINYVLNNKIVCILNKSFSHIVEVAVPKSHYTIVCFNQLAEGLIL